ncbi:asialoglycoprotein receptor 1 [Varanus komodoensis]|uniref:C-type lectin domain-containing protein n=1 Tax=Varanus komodoensis TaxID=61221 RepID=A0A8D2LDD4_VARKO|nr:asialoglycoprotein receptor 1 [Varanus komodoensis]
MVEEYHNFSSLDAEEEEGRTPVQKAPALPLPSPVWRQRLCPSRRLVLILLGASFALLLAIIIIGARGQSSSSRSQQMGRALRALNSSVAEKMGVLQQKEATTDAKRTQTEELVKKLTEHVEAARTRLLAQMHELRRNMRILNCDLENLKKNRTAGAEACCPRGWVAFRRSCYWHSKDRKTWEDARAECEAVDAHLAVIESYEEHRFVAEHVRPTSTWIGLTDSSGSWKWVDGSSFSFGKEQWCPNQPDNWYGHGLGSGEDCAHLTQDSCWNDSHCTRTYGWVCEMEIRD